jgi:DNA-binding transcriptional regulator YdaS (Cro superfamily)
MHQPTIIQTLGGAKAVADLLRERQVDVADVTVRSWTLSGRSIPAKYWTHIAEIARSLGKDVSIEELARSVAASRSPAFSNEEAA